jgi:hypothetical protein
MECMSNCDWDKTMQALSLGIARLVADHLCSHTISTTPRYCLSQSVKSPSSIVTAHPSLTYRFLTQTLLMGPMKLLQPRLPGDMMSPLDEHSSRILESIVQLEMKKPCSSPSGQGTGFAWSDTPRGQAPSGNLPRQACLLHKSPATKASLLIWGSRVASMTIHVGLRTVITVSP